MATPTPQQSSSNASAALTTSSSARSFIPSFYTASPSTTSVPFTYASSFLHRTPPSTGGAISGVTSHESLLKVPGITSSSANNNYYMGFTGNNAPFPNITGTHTIIESEFATQLQQELEQVYAYYSSGEYLKKMPQHPLAKNPHKDGFLSKREYKLAFISIFGYKPSKFELDLLFSKENYKLGVSSAACQQRADANTVPNDTLNETAENEVFLGKADFMKLMKDKLRRIDMDDHITQTFKAFDRDGKGYLTQDDVQAAFEEITKGAIPIETVTDVFKEFDRNNDGRVTRKDFDRMMKYGHH